MGRAAAKITSALIDLTEKFRRVPQTISSLSAELAATTYGLGQVRQFVQFKSDRSPNGLQLHSAQAELIESLNPLMVNLGRSFVILDCELTKLNVPSSVGSGSISWRRRIQFLWVEGDLKYQMESVRTQRESLDFVLTRVQMSVLYLVKSCSLNSLHPNHYRESKEARI